METYPFEDVSITKKERVLLEYIVKDYLESTNGTTEGYWMQKISANLLAKVDQGVYDYFDYDLYKDIVKAPSSIKGYSENEDEREFEQAVWIALR